MTKRIRAVVTAVAAVAALATGGAVFAQAQNSGTTPANPPAAAQEQAPENSAADTDSVQNENGKDDATEAPGAEKAEAPGQEGSEVPGDDGPGGHADEPGNPNADHQFQGNE